MSIESTSQKNPILQRLLKEAWPKEVWVGWFSSLVEAYNMAIYSFIAPLLAPLLFQNTTPFSAVFFSYSLIFLGSVIFYPAGAIYFGFKGDRYGRQKICFSSTLGLAVVTGLMGLISLHLINYSWVYFLLLISFQHFFSGGEYHGSIVFSLEHSEDKKNGLMSSLSCLFAVFGLILANGFATFSFIKQDPFWIPICFFVGGVSGLISYALKNHCRETPAFHSLSQETLKEMKWSSFIKEDWQKIISTILVLAFFIVSYSFIFIFLPLVKAQANIEDFSSIKLLITYGIFLVLSGLLADRIGNEKCILMGMGLFSLTIIPLSYFCTISIFQVILTIFACLTIGPLHSWMLHQFNIIKRCRGIFISSALATSIFSGSVIPICLMIFEKTNSLTACSLYPLAIALTSFLYLLYQQSKKVIIYKN